MIRKAIRSRFGWVWVLLLLISANLALSFLPFRLDLTAERRYTLSEPVKEMLKGLDDGVSVTVLLDGDMPAGFRRLSGSAEDMLNAFRRAAPGAVSFRFERPGIGMDDSSRIILYDSLQRLGVNPTNVKAQTKKGESAEETLVFPGAVVSYKGREAGVDFLQGVGSAGLDALNRSEALMEYKLAEAIRKVSRDTVPMVGYLAGNGEPLDLRVYDLIERTLRPNYGFRILPIDSVSSIPTVFRALCVVKPLVPFTETQKFKIDQYVMNGGRVVWMLDRLYAGLDSLERSEGQFIAFDLGLNLEDLLFKYGVRINTDLVQDLQNDGIPSVVGKVGDKPQIQVLPWPYHPLLRDPVGHPVTRNLDYVVSQFPHSIDTVKSPGIRKTILLTTSPNSRILQTPARVEWNSIRKEEDLREFNRGSVPVAVLLEGGFTSLYANRVSQSLSDSMAAAGRPFLPSASAPNRMAVVADGDLALNPVSQQDGPLSMGMNGYTRQSYANRDFLLNLLTYLTDDSGILEARGKDYTLRLLDPEKVEREKTFWQVFNIAAPILTVLLFLAGFRAWHRRRYARA
jgi:gliding-associated putative ABC transporter substrate-binding component GldG